MVFGIPFAFQRLNSRTGTVVMNEHIRLRSAAVSHGNLVVTIRESYSASQPPFSGGDTVVLPDSNIVVDQGDKHLFIVPEGNSLHDVVNAINAVGATPSDLMAVLQALEQAGAEDQALRSVAQDFEAMMLEQMLKSMRDVSEVLAEDGLLSSREQKFWREFQDSQLALELARCQGLGLADAIVAQVEGAVKGG